MSTLQNSILTGADFTDAFVNGADFRATTPHGFTMQQLYSTVSYKQNGLRGVNLEDNDMTGWSFAGQNLASAGILASERR